MATFVDRVVLHVTAGNGGHGCASVHREKFKPLGGPDGGNGGRGGDIVLVVDPQVHTLLDFHHHPHRKAGNGKAGAGDHRNGAERRRPGPAGARRHGRARRRRRGARRPGRRRARASSPPRAAAAGSATRRWPRPGARRPASRCSASRARPRDVVLELKTRRRRRAGRLPDAPASRRLVAAMSAARPEDRRLPVHHAGPQPRRRAGGRASVFTVADVPGLIPGASEGKGLGLEFLRHVERCAVLRARARLRHARARPRPAQRPRRHRGRARRVRRLARRPAASGRGWSRSTRSTCRRPRSWPTWSAPTSRPAGCRSSRSRRPATRGCASSVRAGRGRSPTTGRAVRPAPARIVLRPRVRRAAELHRRRRTRTRRVRSSCAARSPSAGSGRPTSATTRPSATSPTGWPGSASRTSWSSSGAVPGARGHDRATSRFDWEPTLGDGRRSHVPPGDAGTTRDSRRITRPHADERQASRTKAAVRRRPRRRRVADRRAGRG